MLGRMIKTFISSILKRRLGIKKVLLGRIIFIFFNSAKKTQYI